MITASGLQLQGLGHVVRDQGEAEPLLDILQSLGRTAHGRHQLDVVPALDGREVVGREKRPGAEDRDPNLSGHGPSYRLSEPLGPTLPGSGARSPPMSTTGGWMCSRFQRRRPSGGPDRPVWAVAGGGAAGGSTVSLWTYHTDAMRRMLGEDRLEPLGVSAQGQPRVDDLEQEDRRRSSRRRWHARPRETCPR